MKKFTFTLFIIVSCVLIHSQVRATEESIDYMVEKYSQGQIADIYKSFYQDTYGPGHLLGDSVSAKKYFMEEISDSAEWGGPDFEYTGNGQNFVRVNMDLVRKGVIPAEVYFDAFKGSLGQVEKPADEVWIEKWTQVDSIINAKDYNFINEKEDRALIKEKMKSRKFTMHHSDNFNRIYNFHYRIISVPQFKILYDKYLKSRKDN